MSKRKKGFWNREYTKAAYLALSDEPAEDLLKFTRYVERHYGRKFLNVTAHALDLGCGNGRNLVYLAKTYGMRGVGYDSSAEAINAAKRAADGLPLEFEARDIREPIPLPDESVTLALDMMFSHVLKRTERFALRAEILRVLRPGGWLFFKTFLRDGDKNAEELLKKFPGPEEGMYLHPAIGVAEHVWREEDIYTFFEPNFTIHKLERSYKHIDRYGRAWKRRTASVYLEKK